MMFFDVIAPAESPQLSTHTYTGIYGGSAGCNTINFDFYYGALKGKEVIAQVGDRLRVRILNADKDIIAETNFVETSSNTEEPTIVDAPEEKK
jgi:ABC-type phosphonate transport system ATPase subunit